MVCPDTIGQTCPVCSSIDDGGALGNSMMGLSDHFIYLNVGLDPADSQSSRFVVFAASNEERASAFG